MVEENKTGKVEADDMRDTIKATIARDRKVSAGQARGATSQTAGSIEPVDDDAPLVTADACTSIGDSLAALTRVAKVGPSPQASAPEMDMNAIMANLSVRPLSEIEQDLRAVEAEFADAETRRRQAEADARSALDGIDKYQAEIDAAIGLLRQNGPAGSLWHRETERPDTVLTLKDEVPASPPGLGSGSKPYVRPAFNFGAER
ncbi:hypothetical protein KRR38_17315 [Novosphingobium sp. G106]|uniref:hypothetical protein n=1 Tax=Novosphingobium sp. G106 TaxID=2849500 RepID=UPI001C2D6E44|nr:hypothetical protein [Novosphingobium sp. G106]MBV1689384.1 hypothetical protein [Novosphingobium sp. G106]